MNLTNAQIRTKARHLLDDNIFGKDWLKSAFLSTLMGLILGLIGGTLFTFFNQVITPSLMTLINSNENLRNSIMPDVVYIVLQILEELLIAIPIGPVMVGLASVHLDLVRGSGNIRIRKFSDGFKQIIDNFQIGFMYLLHVSLWTALFIIPGIMVCYSYSMAFYVKNDHPDYTWRECFDESERIMEGNRWRLFKLHCNFVGWALLGIVAFLGVGLLWVMPYMQVSTAVFYEEAKKSKE
jgi:uncharacterized membrane protein